MLLDADDDDGSAFTAGHWHCVLCNTCKEKAFKPRHLAAELFNVINMKLLHERVIIYRAQILHRRTAKIKRSIKPVETKILR